MLQQGVMIFKKVFFLFLFGANDVVFHTLLVSCIDNENVDVLDLTGLSLHQQGI